MLRGNITSPSSLVDAFRRHSVSQMERAAVRSVSRIASMGKVGIRSRFAGAGLGRLGNAIDANADQGAVRYGRDGFSVSARFFTRTRSERTLGAIKAYTEGATIMPVRSPWLWIPTDDIPVRAGSTRSGGGQRMTPALWRQRGYDKTIGPLRKIKSVNGNPLLVVENVGTSEAGARRSVKSLTKSGRARRGQRKRDLVVCFVGIPRTSRAARVNITNILLGARSELPSIFESELAKERR